MAHWRPLLQFVLPVLFVWLALALPDGRTAHAQTATPPPAATQAPLPERLKSVESQLEQIASTLKRKNLSDEALRDLRQRLNPLLVETESVLEAYEAEHKSAQSRLAQLGPTPKDGAPPESDEAKKQRETLTKVFNEVDARLKRAKVVRVGVDQLADTITNRRRDILQRTLLQKQRSILHPALWSETMTATGTTATQIRRLLQDWMNYARNILDKGLWQQFLAFLVLLGAFTWALYRAARWILPRAREIHKPEPFHKVRNALWVAVVVFAVPSLSAWLLLEGLRYFDLINFRIEPLFIALLHAVQRIALTAGLARALLAPAKPAWRLLSIDTPRAVRLSRLAFRIICIVAVIDIVEVLLTMVAAPLIISQVVMALGTLAAALLIGRTLYGTADEEAQYDAELGPVVTSLPAYIDLWRLLIWLAIVIIIAGNLFGYFNLAGFVLKQIVWVTFVCVAAYIVIRFIETGLATGLQPDSFTGHVAAATFGLRDRTLQQAVILLTGTGKLLVYFIAAIVLLAPLGIETASVVDTANAVFFGFNIGGVRISLSSVAIAIILLVAGYAVARAFRHWLEKDYLPTTQLDIGLQNSIATSAGYIGIIGAIAFSLGYLGLNFEKLAIVAGALSLGIGFGLQSIVNNFVSGLILLWERSIKVGDWIVVGTDEGYVRRITVRSTEIETFDKQIVIVPNSNLISGVVKNYVRNNTIGRIIIPVGVSYGSDPEQVRDILLECAKTHELIMEEPQPYVVFADFADSSLNFELRCHLSNVDKSLTVRSHLRYEIFRRLKEAGIEIPFPQRDINLRDIDRLGELLGKTSAAREQAIGTNAGDGAPEPNKS